MTRLSECPKCGFDGLEYGEKFRYCPQCREDLDAYMVTLPCCGVRILPHPECEHNYCAYCGGKIPEGLIPPLDIYMTAQEFEHFVDSVREWEKRRDARVVLFAPGDLSEVYDEDGNPIEENPMNLPYLGTSKRVQKLIRKSRMAMREAKKAPGVETESIRLREE